MTLGGIVQNGAVMLENGTTLPEGTRVQVVVPDGVSPQSAFQDLLNLAGTVNDLPEGMALNHDHYLHGHPEQ